MCFEPTWAPVARLICLNFFERKSRRIFSTPQRPSFAHRLCIMFISLRCKSGLFCLFCFLLITLASVSGQLLDEANTSSKNGAPNKVNSMRVNKITSDSIEQGADTDRVVVNDKYSSLNSKYVTQSTVTSGPPSGLSSLSKKSKFRKNLASELRPIKTNCLVGSHAITRAACRAWNNWLHLIERLSLDTIALGHGKKGLDECVEKWIFVTVFNNLTQHFLDYPQIFFFFLLTNLHIFWSCVRVKKKSRAIKGKKKYWLSMSQRGLVSKSFDEFFLPRCVGEIPCLRPKIHVWSSN